LGNARQGPGQGRNQRLRFSQRSLPAREGFHCLSVNKHLRTGAAATVGDTVHFHLEPYTIKRVATVPIELQRILNEDRSFHRWFNQLTFSMRSWICYWIVSVKSPEARVRRAGQVAEQLLSTMEAASANLYATVSNKAGGMPLVTAKKRGASDFPQISLQAPRLS
jgi:hypothetical protein